MGIGTEHKLKWQLYLSAQMHAIEQQDSKGCNVVLGIVTLEATRQPRTKAGSLARVPEGRQGPGPLSVCRVPGQGKMLWDASPAVWIC